MPTLGSCRFLDIVVLSVQEYNKNLKNKIRRINLSPSLHTYILHIHTYTNSHLCKTTHTQIHTHRDTHTHAKQPCKVICSIFLWPRHMTWIFKNLIHLPWGADLFKLKSLSFISWIHFNDSSIFNVFPLSLKNKCMMVSDSLNLLK